MSEDRPYALRLGNPGKHLYPPPVTPVSSKAFHARLSRLPQHGDAAQLYIHIPFCETICTFCPIHKERTPSDANRSEYLRSLQSELIELSRLTFIANLRVTSVYFGGGTATILSDAELASLMEVIQQRFNLDRAQITLEGHVRTLFRQKLEIARQLGFNRISAGIQTFDPDLRRQLNLTPSSTEVYDCVRTARTVGFDDINLDLMYNLPGQTRETWTNDLRNMIELNPSGIDLYETTLATGTALYAQVRSGVLPAPLDAVQAADAYSTAEDMLHAAGYEQKNLFVWDRAGFENRLIGASHQLRDGNMHVIGAGLSAFSLFDGQPFVNEFSRSHYTERVRETGSGVLLTHECNRERAMEQFMIMSLNDMRFDCAAFEHRFGIGIEHEFSRQLKSFLKRGLIVRTPAAFELTRRGRAWATTMSIEFYHPNVLKGLMDARMRGNYFVPITYEEELQLPVFAVFHPEEVLKDWWDPPTLWKYIRYLHGSNPRWTKQLLRLISHTVRQHGIPNLGWYVGTALGL